jgi:hypothetical protein
MKIRAFRMADVPQLRRIHQAQGYGFKFPETKELFAKFTVEADDGRVVGFAGAEKTVQVFGIFDSSWGSPHQRLQAIQALHEPIRQKLKAKGFKTVHVWLDPKWPKFGKRLSRMGWAQALWTCFWKKVE